MQRKLQVFVSSTFIDLIEERQAAVAAILKAGHIPAGMELFTSGDQSQMATIKRWIEESDVYMLILGGRYGSIEPTSTLSYTELEYEYARSLGKPLFSVVISDDAHNQKIKSHGASFIETENPVALRLFRQKVLQNVSSFFTDAKDIRLCVYESLSDLEKRPDLKGWVSATQLGDIEALKDEVRRFREENVAIREENRLKENTFRLQGGDAANPVSEQLAVLRAIPIHIPADVSPTNASRDTNLLDLLQRYSNTFITGLVNRRPMTDWSKFLYFKVFPRLIAHDLAEIENIPGFTHRRYALNAAGRAVVAELEKRMVLGSQLLGHEASEATNGEDEPTDSDPVVSSENTAA